MFSYRSLPAGLGLVLAATSAQAQSTASPAPSVTAPTTTPLRRYPQASVGLTLGWGAPYGWGADLSYMLMPKLDVNVGVGLTITGTKIGVGARYYFSPEHKVSPFAGANLVHSGGINGLRVTANQNNNNYGGYGNSGDQAIVNYKAANLLHLRAGVRWQPVHRFAMIGALGYGVVLGGNPVEYVDQPYGQATRDAVNLLAPGGLELSVGVAFGLGRRN